MKYLTSDYSQQVGGEKLCEILKNFMIENKRNIRCWQNEKSVDMKFNSWECLTMDISISSINGIAY